MPITILKERDKKGVYSNNKNVVGLDIDWEKPIASADLILKYEEKLDPDKMLTKVIKSLKKNTKI